MVMNVETFKFVVIDNSINLKYMISNFGTIINVEKKNKILKPSNTNQYKVVCIGNKTHGVHRLVLSSFIGGGDKLVCDHINGIKYDNRLSNLRWATIRQNCMNKQIGTLGYKGVRYNEKTNKYYAYITHIGVRQHLGSFVNLNDAKTAYNDKAVELFGEFARLNTF